MYIPPGVTGSPLAGLSGASAGEAPPTPTPDPLETAQSLVGDFNPGILFDPASFTPEALTPEMILVMLHKRLSALDSQIQMETAAIQNAAKESEGLSETIQALGAIRDAMAAENPKSDEKVDLDNLTVSVDGQTFNATALVDELGLREELELDGDNKTSREVVKGYIERLQMKQRSINSNNEMNMVRLQSAIGKRQQAIQLSTNMVNNINQSLMDIIRNTK